MKKMNLPRVYFNNTELKWESLLYQTKTNIFLDLVPKEFNMILIQIFYILVCYIFRLSGKVKLLGK